MWTIFGAIFLAALLTAALSWAAIGYAILSLTVIRMLPVAIALVGQGFRRGDAWPSSAGSGRGGWPRWSSPCSRSKPCTTPGRLVGTLIQVATWTILLSVLLHGLTAGPLGARYGRRINEAGPSTPELAGADEPRMRRRTVGA